MSEEMNYDQSLSDFLQSPGMDFSYKEEASESASEDSGDALSGAVADMKAKNEEGESEEEKAGEEVEEGDDVSDEDDSKDTKESIEELPEFVEMKEKALKAEKRLKVARTKIREAEEKAKAVEEQFIRLKGSGHNALVAEELVEASASGNFNKLMKTLGFDPDEQVKIWGKTLGWTKEREEDVKEHLKRKELEEMTAKERRRLAEQENEIKRRESEVVKRDWTLKAENFVRKNADKFHMLASLEDKALNQLQDEIKERHAAGDAKIRSCKTYEEALAVVAVDVEKKLYREGKRVHEAIQALKEKRAKKESAKPEEQKKKDPSKKEAPKPKEEEKSDKKAKSPTGSSGKKKLSEKDEYKRLLSRLNFSTKE